MASIPIPAHRKSLLVDLLTTVDHKKIGVMYMVASFVFFIFSGVLALIIRTQLAAPGLKIIDQNLYNQVFTMHGTGMIFLFTIPMLVGGFGNYFLPLQIGARDVAFPRINAYSFWMYIFAAIVMEGGFALAMLANVSGMPDPLGLKDMAANAAWTSYPPLSSVSPAKAGMDIWLFGLILNGIASTLGAVNFVVTAWSMRAPGMTTWRIPLFTWAMITTAVMILFSTPVLTAALVMLTSDRNFGTQFFRSSDTRLYQHMFWFYSHPAVYIMVLPAMGIISEVLPVFARKPLFGPKAIILSTILIALLGFTTWAHHMFVSGISPELQRFFMFTTMVIAVPTGIKIFNWIFTLWGGSLNMKTALLMMFGFISTFTVGGITGVVQGMVPADLQLHNTYWVVAHFHYVLFGGSVFGIFGGFFYWMPKITGKMLGEGLGKLQFWLMFIGFNLTFGPMHLLGLYGMPRRIATYYAGRPGWDLNNLLSTLGAFTIALAVLIFIINFWKTMAGPRNAPENPWEGNTLEWDTTSPPPEYNFKHIPTVTSDRPLWDKRHGSQGGH
jgi:cytochrome c oxidase subunit I